MFVMALPWLLVLELVLYAGCFICGIIAAASLTINQVRQHLAQVQVGGLTSPVAIFLRSEPLLDSNA